jgi:hypothetical protein
MLQRDGVVMMMMKVLVMMVMMVMMIMMMMMMMMMILMKPSLMTMMMAMISPLREGISLADFCLPESFLSWCFPSRRGGGVYLRSSLLVFFIFRGDDIHEGAMP